MIPFMALLAGAAEYTDCISAEMEASSKECFGYDTKQSDGEAPIFLEFWRTQSTPSLISLSRSTLAWN